MRIEKEEAVTWADFIAKDKHSKCHQGDAHHF